MTTPFLIDDSEFDTEKSAVTPYEILDQCKSLLEERGRMRDGDQNILESSFNKAAEVANTLFYIEDHEIMPIDVIKIMIAIKLARIRASTKNHREDIESAIDLINYLAFYIAEIKNHY